MGDQLFNHVAIVTLNVLSTLNMFILQLTKEAEVKVSKSRELIDTLVKENKTVYGITTGFGKFARTVIEKKKLE